MFVSQIRTKHTTRVHELTIELTKQRGLKQDSANAVEKSMTKLKGLAEEQAPLARSYVTIAKEFAIMEDGKKQWDTLFSGDAS